MDIRFLFTNIPREYDIRACKELWEERLAKYPPKETLVKLLILFLKCDNYKFKWKHYLQVQGTAMGINM